MDSSLLEVFIFENSQLLEQLEKTLLAGEKSSELSKEQLNDIFRVMHTIKGAASMMEFSELAKYAHALEDLFDYIRSHGVADSELWEDVFDVALCSIDYFKEELAKLQEGREMDGDNSALYQDAKRLLSILCTQQQSKEAAADALIVAELGTFDGAITDFRKNGDGVKFKVIIEFDADCGMETIRAMGITNSLKGLYSLIRTVPTDLEQDHDKEICENGFMILIETSLSKDELLQKLGEAILVSKIEVEDLDPRDQYQEDNEISAQEIAEASEGNANVVEHKADAKAVKPDAPEAPMMDKNIRQSYISINVSKIDRLMNLVGEIVTSESMVTKNPDLAGLKLENFSKQARHLRKLTNELQDVVMSIRMVPISSAFNKMQRIVRDMSKKIGKEAELRIIGETTEVDKNVIDALSDPLMHLIRNSMDHGLEPTDERIAVGKDPAGVITLEAYNTGGDVIVSISDDGRGLNKSKIVKKAQDMGLTTKTEEEIPDNEAFAYILEPGFSTNVKITEYSGRGVGMDVVHKNIESVNGAISIDSKAGEGTVTKIHIPLTLSIVEGMVVSVGQEQYIIPILSIKESFESRLQKVFVEPNGTEMVIIRGECYRIIKLANIFNIDTDNHDYSRGIMVMVEAEIGATCLFVDRLIGEQQAVIKPIPEYITRNFGRVKGISGCTVLGDGSISMILDTNAIINMKQ